MVGLAVVLVVAGRILGVTELFGLAVAAAVVAGVGSLRVRAQLRVALTAQVVPPVVSTGERASFELTVENTGSAPTPRGRLRLVPASGAAGPVVEIPRLVPGEQAAVSLRLPTNRRGRHEIAGFDAMLVDGLGIAERRITGIGSSRYGVRPEIELLPAALPAGGGGGDLETTRSSAARLSTGVSLLRPYADGDDLRRVHWLTTARIGSLMVREGGDRERDAGSGITIVLSNHVASRDERDAAAFEDAVRITASLAVAASEEGPFRLVIPGNRDSRESTGARHLDSILDTLIDVTALPLMTSETGAEPPAGSQSSLDLVAQDAVAILVVACPREEDFVHLLGASADRVLAAATAVVVVRAGAEIAGLESLGRGRLLVNVPLNGSLAALWSAGDHGLVTV